MPIKLCFIINALRKKNHDINELIDSCQSHDHFSSVLIQFTEYAGHATELASNAAGSGTDIIVAIGGDGTFNEVVNGIMKSKNPGVILALIPNGTGNDFCRSQQITYSKKAFLHALIECKVVKTDIASISAKGDTAHFINVADIGFGGLCAHNLNKQRKVGLGGDLSYTLAILRTFVGFKMPEVAVYGDDIKIYQGRLMMLAVCNGSTFGNGIIIQPDAITNDGILHLALLGEVSLWDYLTNFFNLKKGKKLSHPSVFYFACRNIVVKVMKGEAAIEMDGEIFGEGDVKISILPEAINLLNYSH